MRRSFPGALPQPNLTTPNMQALRGVQNTPMQSGIVRARQTFDHMPTTFQATWTFSRDENVIFVSFLKKNGSAEFEMNLDAPFQLETIRGRHAVQLIGDPQTTEAGSFTWEVSALVRLTRLDVPDYDDIAFLANFGESGARIAQLFDQLANIETPKLEGS